MIPLINYWAVILATLSSMIVGSMWYTPKVFGNYWMKATGVTPSGKASDAVEPIVTTVLVSFVTAWVLAGSVSWRSSLARGLPRDNHVGEKFPPNFADT